VALAGQANLVGVPSTVAHTFWESFPQAPYEQRLVELLPEPEEVSFDKGEGPLFFSPETLYEYINGAAEAYLDFDFACLIQQVYTRRDGELTVDIYDLRKPINAFGIYAAERSPNADFISIGTEGYQSDYVLNFVQGPYYVKLSAFDLASPVLEEFAREISNRIPDAKKLPVEFSVFPDRNRVKHSEAYFRKSPLGHEFLSPALQASYKVGGEDCVVMLSAAANAADARERAGRLQRHLDRAGEVEWLDDWGPGAFRGTARYQGALVAAPVSSYVLILLDPPQGSSTLFRKVMSAVDHQE
jgi:hypothetical protein